MQNEALWSARTQMNDGPVIAPRKNVLRALSLPLAVAEKYVPSPMGSFVRFAYPEEQSVSSVALFSHFMLAAVARAISGEWPLAVAIAAVRSGQAERQKVRECEFADAGNCRPAVRCRHRQQSPILPT